MLTHELGHLYAEFLEAEVLHVFILKALGLYGSTGRFNAFYQMYVRFFGLGNQALIYLHPKKLSVVKKKSESGPCLIHSVAKLLAKSLVSRVVLDVPNSEGGHGRAIMMGIYLHDNSRLVQITTRRIYNAWREWIMPKHYIMKAFDTMEFLLIETL
jgi:hypothetical protein